MSADVARSKNALLHVWMIDHLPVNLFAVALGKRLPQCWHERAQQVGDIDSILRKERKLLGPEQLVATSLRQGEKQHVKKSSSHTTAKICDPHTNPDNLMHSTHSAFTAFDNHH